MKLDIKAIEENHQTNYDFLHPIVEFIEEEGISDFSYDPHSGELKNLVLEGTFDFTLFIDTHEYEEVDSFSDIKFPTDSEQITAKEAEMLRDLSFEIVAHSDQSWNPSFFGIDGVSITIHHPSTEIIELRQSDDLLEHLNDKEFFNFKPMRQRVLVGILESALEEFEFHLKSVEAHLKSKEV